MLRAMAQKALPILVIFQSTLLAQTVMLATDGTNPGQRKTKNRPARAETNQLSIRRKKIGKT